MDYSKLTLIKLIELLLRSERLIALIESGVQIMEGFEPEVTQNMLTNAYNRKKDIQIELDKRKPKAFDLFKEISARATLYCNSYEELKTTGMAAPVNFEPKPVNHA